MSFQAPLFLLLLLLLPLAVVAYVVAQRSRRRYAVRYPALDVLAGVHPGPLSAFRRLAPPLLLALALATLIVGLARPEATVAVGREQAAVVLATDTSGSMQATDIAPDRITAIRKAANDFLDEVPDEVLVGLVAFSSSAQTLEAPTTDRTRVRRAVGRLRPRRSSRTPAAIVLLSDGKETKGVPSLEAARRARQLRVPISTIALGTATGSIEVRRAGGNGTRRQAVPPDAATLRQIARISGGRFSAAPSSRELARVYERLGSSVVKVPERQQITAGFAGGALVLVLLAAGIAAVGAGRLP